MKKVLLFAIDHIILWLRLTRLFVFKLLAFFIRPVLAKKQYWLLLERGTDAQDNAWHFFKYLRTKHPEVNALFAIHKKSRDYKSNLVGYYDNVIEYNSFWYYMVLYNCRIMLSTHAHTYVYKVWSNIKGGILDIRGKKVSLHHGICHSHNKAYQYPNLNVDVNFCGALNEYEVFKNVYGYPESFLCYSGLARFDNLHDNIEKKQVLIMPTWRVKYANLVSAQFEETDFFQAYKTILTDSTLLDALNKYDYDLVFYNHYEFQKFNNSYKVFCKGRVKLKFFGDLNVQQLLKESRLLITDYSSIYYDFLYMRKPIVFFMMDKEEFQTQHYGKSFDDQSNFGSVTTTPGDVVEQIKHHIQNDCKIERKYLEFSNKIFPLRDKKNCERIYQKVSGLLN